MLCLTTVLEKRLLSLLFYHFVHLPFRSHSWLCKHEECNQACCLVWIQQPNILSERCGWNKTKWFKVVWKQVEWEHKEEYLSTGLHRWRNEVKSGDWAAVAEMGRVRQVVTHWPASDEALRRACRWGSRHGLRWKGWALLWISHCGWRAVLGGIIRQGRRMARSLKPRCSYNIWKRKRKRRSVFVLSFVFLKFAAAASDRVSTRKQYSVISTLKMILGFILF